MEPAATEIRQEVEGIARAARLAWQEMAKSTGEQRSAALRAIADAVIAGTASILEANRLDLAAAEKNGLSSAMVDRLRLDEARVQKLSQAVAEVADLPEVLGRLERAETRPNGLEVARMRIPLGVIAMIYESRPNVTTDAAALCIKSGNAVILRGGKEAFHSNRALGAAVAHGLEQAGLPAAAVQVLGTTDRAAAHELLRCEGLVDLVIPRGGESLIRYVAENAKVPVLKHYKGVCHVYVHAAADPDMALAICANAKAQRPGVCNAAETLLIDAALANDFLPLLGAKLRELGVEMAADDAGAQILGSAGLEHRRATEKDWDSEYLDLIVSIAVVADLDAALGHIARHASDHTESIVTSDAEAAERFLREVQSSTVLHNASTRFADGGELGLGAEIGVSTTKLHAYGPMGVEGLTTTKFVVRGNGQVRT